MKSRISREDRFNLFLAICLQTKKSIASVVPGKHELQLAAIKKEWFRRLETEFRDIENDLAFDHHLLELNRQWEEKYQEIKRLFITRQDREEKANREAIGSKVLKSIFESHGQRL